MENSNLVALPKEAEEEAKVCIHLQQLLNDLTEENIENTAQLILNSQFSKDPSRIAILVDSLFTAATYRPRLIPLYARIVAFLMQNKSSENSLEKFKPIFLREVTRSADVNSVYMAKIPLFYYWYQCYTNGAFTFDDIAEHLSKWLKDDKAYSPNQLLVLYILFLPDIDKSSFAESLRRIVIMKKSDGYISDDLMPVAQLLSRLKENDWEIYKEITQYGCLKNTLQYILKYDCDVEFGKLVQQSKQTTGGFDPEQTIEAFPLEPSHFIHKELTLLQYAAYFGAAKCFKLLLALGADIDNQPHEDRTILDYAIDGLNDEIFEIVSKANVSIIQSLKTAAQFRNYDAFEKIYNNVDVGSEEFEDSMKHVMKICAKSGNFNTLVYCIEKGHDPTIKYKDGLLLPHYAAIHGHTGILHFLISLGSFNVNCTAQWVSFYYYFFINNILSLSFNFNLLFHLFLMV